MSTPFAAFKDLLYRVPKFDTSDSFKARDVHQYYLDQENRTDVEAFFGMWMDILITSLVQHQDVYIEFYDKYKAISLDLKRIFEEQQANGK